jgi:heptosyltransferase I
VKMGFDRRRARDLNWLFTNWKIPPHENQHVQDQYFEFLDALGVPHERVEWGIGPWPGEAHPLPARQPYAAIAPCSAVADRNWRSERWAQVVDALQERHGLHAVLVGGRSPAEVEAERIIMERAHHKPTSTLGNTLREMVAVLAASELVLSVDTSVQHIATAVGRPVISLIAALDPKRTGPYGASQALVVNGFTEPDDPPAIMMTRRPGRMDRITVPQVLEKLSLWASRR